MDIGKEILKASGLYTKNDVKRFEDNNKELWDALNEVCSYLSVYGTVIKHEIERTKAENPDDSKLELLIHCSNRLLEAEKTATATLNKCTREF